MAQEFPLLELEGDAHECGVQHGSGAAGRVARSVELYLAAFEKQTTLTLAEVRERARGFAVEIERIDPDILEELRGIAAGAHQRFEDIVAVNCRTELLYGDKSGARPATECTTIAALPEATAERRILLGKNWDWRDACIDSVVLLKIAQRGKPRLALMVEAGMVGRDGFNEHGIAVVGNLLVSNHDKGRPGVPIPILRRRILHATTYYEAIDTLARSPRGASGNYVIAHRDGVAIDFEVTPEEVFAVYPERGLLTHANHFQSPAAHARGVTKFYTGDSLYRDFRARQLLEAKIGNITRADIEATLRDHFGLPRSICRHPHQYQYGEPTMTIASIVFDLQRSTMYVAAGQPCQSGYRAVGLPREREILAHAG